MVKVYAVYSGNLRTLHLDKLFNSEAKAKSYCKNEKKKSKHKAQYTIGELDVL